MFENPINTQKLMCIFLLASSYVLILFVDKQTVAFRKGFLYKLFAGCDSFSDYFSFISLHKTSRLKNCCEN